MHTYSILSVPFYDARLQQYTKILCINAAPVGPLAARVKTVRPPRLSGLSAPQNHPCNCLHALCCSSACSSSLSALGGSFLTPDDLPELFAFLATNGYTVDLGLTKLAAKHPSSGANAHSLVCLISYK
jgi:hypothetical protein